MEPLFHFVIGDRQAHINWLGPRFLQVLSTNAYIHTYITCANTDIAARKLAGEPGRNGVAQSSG